MQPLQVVPADVKAFGEGHSEVAGQVETASFAADAAVASMADSYGSVGAVFTAAVAQFNASLKACSRQLSNDYRVMAAASRTTADGYTTVDEANGARLATSQNRTTLV